MYLSPFPGTIPYILASYIFTKTWKVAGEKNPTKAVFGKTLQKLSAIPTHGSSAFASQTVRVVLGTTDSLSKCWTGNKQGFVFQDSEVSFSTTDAALLSLIRLNALMQHEAEVWWRVSTQPKQTCLTRHDFYRLKPSSMNVHVILPFMVAFTLMRDVGTTCN